VSDERDSHSLDDVASDLSRLPRLWLQLAPCMERVRAQLASLVILPALVAWLGVSGGGGGDLRWLALAPWMPWLSLRFAARRTALREPVRRVDEVWRRLDPLLAAALLYAILLRPPRTLLLPLLIAAAMALVLALLRRANGPVWVALLSAWLVFAVIVPRAFEALLLSRIASTHALDVDHRMWPDGKEINSNGVRFRGEATDLRAEDFVVLFLGDSFTYGFNLPYDEAYPYQFERIAHEAGCRVALRAVDFGWTSSSPLLSLRLLREVGYRYQPDLILYNLDMTDFHDDLRYEKKLREQGDFEIDRVAVLERLTATRLPWLVTPMSKLRALLREDAGGRERLLADLAIPGPNDRYFVTAHPLERTRPAIELGVVKNLDEMNTFARDVLGVPMLLMIYPRAYQYSSRESPYNWEAGEYETLGPYVREPFRYFEERRGGLPYPVLNLLPAFEHSDEFPLYFGNDPHWNARGARLAARTVETKLAEMGRIPCRPWSAPGKKTREAIEAR